MRIIAFDPGGTTGVATYDDNNCRPIMIAEPYWGWKELTGEDHHWQIWNELLYKAPFDAVVYETFVPEGRKNINTIAQEYIGVIKLALHNDSTLIPQSRAQKQFWTDERLRKLGLWRSSKHERDATRHLLYYVSFTLKDKRFLNRL